MEPAGEVCPAGQLVHGPYPPAETDPAAHCWHTPLASGVAPALHGAHPHVAPGLSPVVSAATFGTGPPLRPCDLIQHMPSGYALIGVECVHAPHSGLSKHACAHAEGNRVANAALGRSLPR